MVSVYKVEKDSLSDLAGIVPGDIILSINGHPVNDILDYRFYIADTQLNIQIHRGPDLLNFEIEKEEYDDIGLDFSSYLMDEIHTCSNKCVFCFIDQNPPGMRSSVYVKDDDSRMSFLTGSYITLTNLKEADIKRIIDMKISPVNISVHTMNPELRCKMMGNRFAGECLKYIDMLAKAKIEINCQIVVCKGINDGDNLEYSMNELLKYAPFVKSVSIVPVGLTKHRCNLTNLSPLEKEDCEKIIGQVDRFRKEAFSKFDVSVFYCSDEIFLTAGRDIPGLDYYDGFPQLENGVGMIRNLSDETADELSFFDESEIKYKNKKCSVATGKAAYGCICDLSDRLMKCTDKLKIDVYQIDNNFFGDSVTVAGLITGSDLISQLKGKELGEVLYITSSMLRYEGDLFLDGVSIEDLEKELGVRVVCVDNNGYDFVEKIMYEE